MYISGVYGSFQVIYKREYVNVYLFEIREININFTSGGFIDAKK